MLTRKWMAGLCFLLLSASILAKDFGYPVDGEPWYFIQAQQINDQSLEGAFWSLKEVSVNDLEVRDFLIFQKGREIFDNSLDGDKSFDLKIRFNWEGDETYNIKLLMEDMESGKTQAIKIKKTSPSLTGYWRPAWKNYISLVVAEEHGIARPNYPIHATVGILSQYLESEDEVRIVRAHKKGNDYTYTELPSQVYDVVIWQDKELLAQKEIDEETQEPITRYHQTVTFSVAFQADLKANEKATFLLFYNNPKADKPRYKTGLKTSGWDLTKQIENSFYTITLDEKSGMIFKVLEKSTGLLLEHKLETNGAIHWNPGSYSPPHSWTHASDWEKPEFQEVEGPVFYSLRRTAPLPHLKDVHVSINYYFYNNSPVILMESTMQVNENLAVKALRNAEIVFNKEIFTQAAYKKVKGKATTIDFSHTRQHPEHVTTLRPDTPWVTFFDDKKQVAFGSLFLESSTSNIFGGPASTQQPYIYIQNGPWYYISRAFVYSFGSSNQTRMLPVNRGSIYYEKNAWIPMTFKKSKDLFRSLDTYYDIFKHPLYIQESMETYPESPKGWLVPILTEPFDEGVKGALGEKKKKK
ncbi:hypothetical protein ACFLT9_13260 [Acidobacteriota bacterium]